MTHSYVRHDSFIRVTWRTNKNRQYSNHFAWGSWVSSGTVPTTKATWCTYMCAMTHWYVWHTRTNFFGNKFVWFSSTLFWVTGTPFTHVRTCLKFCDSRENVFDMYGDSSEGMLEILAVVIISSPTSSICGDFWWVYVTHTFVLVICMNTKKLHTCTMTQSAMTQSYCWHTSAQKNLV